MTNFDLKPNLDFLHKTEVSDGTIRMEDDINLLLNHSSL
jgi:hypothetical protein